MKMKMFRHPRWFLVLATFPLLALAAIAERTPPRPTEMVAPVYPPELREGMVEGEAVITVLISETGKPSEASVFRTTHEGFGEAALEAAWKWEFEPATENGVPVASRVNIPFQFSLPPEDRLNFHFGRKVYKPLDEDVRIFNATDIPAGSMPKLLQATYPRYPEDLKGSGRVGEVRIRFIIDTNGQVINPQIQEGSDVEFIRNALIACLHQTYEPLIVEGDPAYVVVEQTLEIHENPPEEATERRQQGRPQRRRQ